MKVLSERMRLKTTPLSLIVAAAYLACGLAACIVIPKYQAQMSEVALPFPVGASLAIGPFEWLALSVALAGIAILKDYKFPAAWLNFSLAFLLVLLVGSVVFAVSRIPATSAWQSFQDAFFASHRNLQVASESAPAKWEKALRQWSDAEDYAARVLVMAKSDPGSRIAERQLWWILTWCPGTPSWKAAVEIYSRDFADDFDIRCRDAVLNPNEGYADCYLRAITQSGPNPQMRGRAMLARAQFRQARHDDAMAESLYKQVIAQFGDLTVNKDSAATLSELARKGLDELRNPDSIAKLRKAGETIPHFDATTTDGNAVQVPDSYKGKILLLDFWATWCLGCREEIPNLVDAYKKYHASGLEILGVSLDKAHAGKALARFTKEHDMPWPQIYDGTYLDSPIASKFDIVDNIGIPYALVVDGDTGMILAEGKEVRGPKLAAAIEKALAKKHQVAK